MNPHVCGGASIPQQLELVRAIRPLGGTLKQGGIQGLAENWGVRQNPGGDCGKLASLAVVLVVGWGGPHVDSALALM